MSTILIVDDEPETVRAMSKLLRKAGFKTASACDAFVAMASAKRARPDLILLDVMIPPMDGLTFLMLLRDDPLARDIPVIVITGLSDDHTVARAKELGVKAHLVKSQFDPDQLLELIRQHTAPQQSAAQ